MKRLKQIIFYLLFSWIFLFACIGGSYKKKLVGIRPNMSKDELLLVMKEPGVVKSSEVGKSGELNEVWEYSFYSLWEEEPITFYFEFADDRLIKWGKVK